MNGYFVRAGYYMCHSISVVNKIMDCYYNGNGFKKSDAKPLLLNLYEFIHFIQSN